MRAHFLRKAIRYGGTVKMICFQKTIIASHTLLVYNFVSTSLIVVTSILRLNTLNVKNVDITLDIVKIIHCQMF